MEHFAQLESFVVVLIAVCALIASVSGACAAVVKFWRYAHRQSDENTESIKEIEKESAKTIEQFETYLASDKRRIEQLESKQDEAEKQNKMLLKGVYALMCHELDGNHTSQLSSSRDEIYDYLFEN